MAHFPKYLYQLGIALLFIGVLTSTSSNAQQTEEDMARFKLADSYLRTGQYEKAIPLLENLYASDSTSVVYYRKLKEAYAALKQYEKAVALVEKRLQSSRTPSLVAEKAALLHQKGDVEEGFETWRAAVELQPNQSGTYRAVYLSMIDNRRFDEAINILREGRERLDRPQAFRMDLGRLYSLTSRHDEAAEEYLSILADEPERLPLVKRRLSRYADQEGALETTIEIVERQIEEDPVYRPYRELAGWLYLQLGRYDEAFEEYRAIDRFEEENGSVLYSFARKAASADAYDIAGDAYELILDRYPDGPATPDARLGMAEMHRKQAAAVDEGLSVPSDDENEHPHYTAALDAYRTFIQNYPDHPEHGATLRKIGELHLDVFQNLDRAETVLERVVDQYPETEEARRAQLALGRVALLRDDLNEAQLIFSRLEDTAETGEVAETARYELALLHFYRSHFMSAMSLTRALTKNTSADIANDALELKLMLTENKGPDSLDTPLQIYARAKLSDRQQKYEEAAERVDSLLTNYASHSLNDNAYFLKAEILRSMGEHVEAAEMFVQLSVRYPNSPLADKSLFQAAELYDRALDDRQAALETYDRLLNEYPGSLLLPDARERIRSLRSEA